MLIESEPGRIRDGPVVVHLNEALERFARCHGHSGVLARQQLLELIYGGKSNLRTRVSQCILQIFPQPLPLHALAPMMSSLG
jgi:hypothetical protein